MPHSPHAADRRRAARSAKLALRSRCLAARDALPADARAAASAAIAARIARLPPRSRRARGAADAPLPQRVGHAAAGRRPRSPPARSSSLPRVERRDADARPARDRRPRRRRRRRGYRGIPEPRPPLSRRSTTADDRLGAGARRRLRRRRARAWATAAGYYDRLLPLLPPATPRDRRRLRPAGVDRVPTAAPHDLGVDPIVTEARSLACPAPPSGTAVEPLAAAGAGAGTALAVTLRSRSSPRSPAPRPPCWRRRSRRDLGIAAAADRRVRRPHLRRRDGRQASACGGFIERYGAIRVSQVCVAAVRAGVAWRGAAAPAPRRGGGAAAPWPRRDRPGLRTDHAGVVAGARAHRAAGADGADVLDQADRRARPAPRSPGAGAAGARAGARLATGAVAVARWACVVVVAPHSRARRSLDADRTPGATVVSWSASSHRCGIVLGSPRAAELSLVGLRLRGNAGVPDELPRRLPHRVAAAVSLVARRARAHRRQRRRHRRADRLGRGRRSVRGAAPAARPASECSPAACAARRRRSTRELAAGAGPRRSARCSARRRSAGTACSSPKLARHAPPARPARSPARRGSSPSPASSSARRSFALLGDADRRLPRRLRRLRIGLAACAGSTFWRPE